MIPNNSTFEITVDTRKIPSNTYKIQEILDENGNRRVKGYTNGIEAVKQAVYLILGTERYVFPIYSWQYGFEFMDLIGQPMAYVTVELKRRIRDALSNDERILGVSNFQFEQNKRKLHVTFTVTCDYGTLDITKEVRV